MVSLIYMEYWYFYKPNNGDTRKYQLLLSFTYPYWYHLFSQQSKRRVDVLSIYFQKYLSGNVG